MDTKLTQKPPSYNESTLTNNPNQNKIAATYNLGHNEGMTAQQANNPLISQQGVNFVSQQPAQVVVVQITPHQTKAPCTAQCLKCNEMVTTKVTLKAGNYANSCCCIICCLTGGTCCLCFIPYCTDSFLDAVHRCPLCNAHLGTCKP